MLAYDFVGIYATMNFCVLRKTRERRAGRRDAIGRGAICDVESSVTRHAHAYQRNNEVESHHQNQTRDQRREVYPQNRMGDDNY